MSPGELLKKFTLSYIKENNLDESLVKEIPKKWEKYGDFVLFDERTFCSKTWKNQGELFWLNISEILKCRRIGVKNKITNDGYRTPNVTILYGEDPWVLHKDNSIIYTWNVEKCMFSAGNVNEKLRIAKLNCENEIVVDLFAGIGYFTLPFLVHSKAAFVHACEWNPAAVEALSRNLTLNKVQDRCKIYKGDNLAVCPKKIGNRVNLGLIPSSERHWKVACEALLDGCGILHIHENVETKKDEILCENCCVLYSQLSSDCINKNITLNTQDRCIVLGCLEICWKQKQWLIKAIHILHSLISILSDLDSSKVWICSIKNINYVKSYAPHVNHLVFDVEISNNCVCSGK